MKVLIDKVFWNLNHNLPKITLSLSISNQAQTVGNFTSLKYIYIYRVLIWETDAVGLNHLSALHFISNCPVIRTPYRHTWHMWLAVCRHLLEESEPISSGLNTQPYLECSILHLPGHSAFWYPSVESVLDLLKFSASTLIGARLQPVGVSFVSWSQACRSSS